MESACRWVSMAVFWADAGGTRRRGVDVEPGAGARCSRWTAGHATILSDGVDRGGSRCADGRGDVGGREVFCLRSSRIARLRAVGSHCEVRVAIDKAEVGAIFGADCEAGDHRGLMTEEQAWG